MPKKLGSTLGLAMNEMSKASDDISKRMGSANALDAVNLIGLDKRFVESELRLMDSLRTGSALFHHLEPSYYAAMCCALDSWASTEKGEKKNETSIDAK